MDQNDSTTSANFWEVKDIREMTDSEWESLCDGCGRCCLNKVEYEDTRTIHFTSAACKLLDGHTCRCSNYPERKKHVPDCISLTSGVVRRMNYLPETCAYRLLAEGSSLKSWHHLISGSRETVHTAGISVRGLTVSEDDISNLDDYLIDWIAPIKLGARGKSPRKKKKNGE